MIIKYAKSHFSRSRSELTSTTFRAYFQVPHAVIDRKIPFNKFGYYLVAELKKEDSKENRYNKVNFFMPVYYNFLAICFIPDLVWISAVTLLIWGNVLRKFKNRCPYGYKNYITKVYLGKDLKQVLLVFGKNDLAKVVEIKNLLLFEEESFKATNTTYGVPIMCPNNQYVSLLPYNISVYDREIFCAIFRGFPIKIKEDEEKNLMIYESTNGKEHEQEKEQEKENPTNNINVMSNSNNPDNTNHIIHTNPPHDTSHDSGSLELNKRTKFNKQMDLDAFFKKKNHFFIMTDGGKPIFSRYGDEVENCGILATFSAMITKFTFFASGQGQNEKLHYIATEKTTTVFVKKGKLFFIALSKCKESSISFMNAQLEYLYIQLLSIITADRMTRLEDNPSYCNSALADTDENFEQMITYCTNTLSPLLNSFQSLVIDSNTRNRLNSICNENKGDALLTVLLTPYEIITICKNEVISSVTAHDIILIQNLIFSSESLRLTESWIPICLPGISDAGYLQIYINFLEQNIGIVFITESQEQSYFLKFSEQSAVIYDTANKENLIESIRGALSHKNKSKISSSDLNSFPQIFSQESNKYNEVDTEKLIEEFFHKLTQNGSSNNIPITHSIGNTNNNANHNSNSNNAYPFGRSDSARNSSTSDHSKSDGTYRHSHSISSNSNVVQPDPFSQVKYLICKNKRLNQYFTFRFNEFDKITPEERIVLSNYCNLYDVYNSNSLSINQNNFFYYEKDQNFSNVIQTNEHYILFCSFNFFKEFESINHLTLEILKLIKFKESYFFINKY